MENRIPGADVNPYLALAAMLAGGLHGIENELPLEDELVGNAYTSGRRRCPHTMRAARELFHSAVARAALGDEVVDHYVNMADVELAAYDAAVTDWELRADSRGSDAAMTDDLHVVNPATATAGRPTWPLADLAETDAAIERAHEAFASWRAMAPGERATLLRRFAAVVDDHIDELAELEVRNAGHTWGNARWEAGNVRDCLNYYSAAPERLFGRQIPVAGGIDVTFHEPLGVVGIIVPWNFPMPIAGWGFAPALAAGNTVVLKPAELTPLTAIRLGELALEAGPARGRADGHPRQGLGGRRALRDPPAGPQGLLHRLHRGRQADHGRLRRAGEAGDPRARRQERQHRLRRRRPGRRGRRRRRTPSSTTPARTAAPARGSSSSGRRTTSSWGCWSPR